MTRNESDHERLTLTRRAALRAMAATTGAAMALDPLAGVARANPSPHALAPRPGHFTAPAQRVIFFFLTGGASHVDSFDYKPDLIRDAGKTVMPGQVLTAPAWKFRRHGKSGLPISDLFPHIGSVADELCVLNSLHTDHANHYEATMGMHTGSVRQAMPSIGAWLSYGLGTFNANLPSHVVFASQLPYAGSQVWDANFLPAYHQGVRIAPGEEPIPHLRPYQSEERQRMELDLLETLNKRHMAERDGDDALKARAMSYQTALGVQKQAPEAFDTAGESDATLNLYGIGRDDRSSFGFQCLAARRLAERGVRFIELIDVGSNSNWDAHGNILSHKPLAQRIDQPVAGLIRDLRSRGMLDSTLIVFCTEFGRTPFARGLANKGREHHRQVFSCWLAGGGVKGGMAWGKSDRYGINVESDGVHVHDFHATILHLAGLDHKRLTYRHGGRDFRLTDVAGDVVRPILA